MYLKSISGKVLFESQEDNIKDAIQEAAKLSVNLDGVNLRKCNLNNIQLNGVRMKGACLWGACLNNAAIIDCDLEAADLRLANLSNGSLENSILSGADFRGAKLNKLNLKNTDISYCYFSDPTFFDLNLHEVRNIFQTVYTARGEADYLVEEFLNSKVKII